MLIISRQGRGGKRDRGTSLRPDNPSCRSAFRPRLRSVHFPPPRASFLRASPRPNHRFKCRSAHRHRRPLTSVSPSVARSHRLRPPSPGGPSPCLRAALYLRAPNRPSDRGRTPLTMDRRATVSRAPTIDSKPTPHRPLPLLLPPLLPRLLPSQARAATSATSAPVIDVASARTVATRSSRAARVAPRPESPVSVTIPLPRRKSHAGTTRNWTRGGVGARASVPRSTSRAGYHIAPSMLGGG